MRIGPWDSWDVVRTALAVSWPSCWEEVHCFVASELSEIFTGRCVPRLVCRAYMVVLSLLGVNEGCGWCKDAFVVDAAEALFELEALELVLQYLRWSQRDRRRRLPPKIP